MLWMAHCRYCAAAFPLDGLTVGSPPAVPEHWWPGAHNPCPGSGEPGYFRWGQSPITAPAAELQAPVASRSV